MYLHLLFLYLHKFRRRACTLSRKVKPAKSQREEGTCTFMCLIRTAHLSVLFPLKIREINTFFIFHDAVSRSQEDASKNSTPGQALHWEMASREAMPMGAAAGWEAACVTQREETQGVKGSD